MITRTITISSVVYTTETGERKSCFLQGKMTEQKARIVIEEIEHKQVIINSITYDAQKYGMDSETFVANAKIIEKKGE